MSGGKETGRQKMVGMMYLVLTALLAMNVSNTIIDKFVFINESLVSANFETKERNVQLLESIIKTVDETGNRESDMAVVDAAKSVHDLASATMEKVNQLKDTMIAITGGYIEYEHAYVGDAKNLMGKTDYSKVGHFMMPIEEGGTGKGEELKELLNTYSLELKAIIAQFSSDESELAKYKPIAVDAIDDPIYNQDPNQQGKIFAQLAFEDSPTPACLATASEFQSRVLSYETRAMSYLSGRVGAGDISFDKIVAMVRPESKYVAAGTPYKAEMFIAASASAMVPTMTYNGREVRVESGKGFIEFIASANFGEKEMESRQTFEASITVPLPGGGDTTYSSIE